MRTPTPGSVRAQSRVADIRADIKIRLGPSSQGMSIVSLDALLDRMAELQYSFEVRALDELFHRMPKSKS